MKETPEKTTLSKDELANVNGGFKPSFNTRDISKCVSTSSVEFNPSYAVRNLAKCVSTSSVEFSPKYEVRDLAKCVSTSSVEVF